MLRLIMAFLFCVAAVISCVQHWDLEPGDPAALYHQVRFFGSMVIAILIGITLQLDSIYQKK